MANLLWNSLKTLPKTLPNDQSDTFMFAVGDANMLLYRDIIDLLITNIV